jgi:hypothetical protein
MTTTTPHTTNHRSRNRFRSRSSLASAGVFAAAAGLAAPSIASAQIIWSGTLDQNVNSGSTQALLDLNGNTTPDAAEAYLTYQPPDSKGNAFLSISGISSSKTDPGVAFLYQDAPVPFGATIDSSLSYVGEHPADLVPATGVGTYYAFKYQAAGGPYYGWAEVSFAPDKTFGTLQQWAYNSTSGAVITTGAVPEPSGLVLLGVAGVAMACRAIRRRRS